MVLGTQWEGQQLSVLGSAFIIRTKLMVTAPVTVNPSLSVWEGLQFALGLISIDYAALHLQSTHGIKTVSLALFCLCWEIQHV